MNKPSLLTEFLKTYPPFDWGEHNCWHCVFDWIELWKGVPIPGSVVGPTPSVKAAYREIQLRGADLSEAFESVYKAPRQPVTTLTTGDIIAAPLRGDTQALGICVGRHAAFLSETGFVYYTMEHMLHGWRVE